MADQVERLRVAQREQLKNAAGRQSWFGRRWRKRRPVASPRASDFVVPEQSAITPHL
ncbi:MAG TPA: hypothetical protein VE975_08475 [Actinomycetota bacterium]|nr:hypothetical protein [Actinomycetota bacterium]